MMEGKKMNLKLNIKSEKGFTMEDLTIALLIITLFVGVVSTMMYKVYKIKLKTDLTSQMVMYAVQILEDIDKIAYEEVKPELANIYNSKFSIPQGYEIEIQVSNYGEGRANIKDLIKIVRLNISYTFSGEKEEFEVTRLKIKEI